jgi:hypothetical protein
VVDCFDALTSDRPYRRKLSDSDAVAILMERRGVMYDPLVVDTFVAVKDELSDSITGGVEVTANIEGLVKPIPTMSAAPEALPPARVAGNQLEARHAIRTVLTAIESELKTSLALVYLKERALDEIVAFDAIGFHSEELVGTILPLGDRVSGWVAANSRAIINTDAKLEFPTWPGLIEDSVCAVLPIRTSTETFGVLLVNRNFSRPFETDEVKFLETICMKFDEAPLRDLINRASAMGPQHHSTRQSVH